MSADWEAQLDEWPRPAGDQLFELVFTSGTTGAPKGVMLTHGNVLASIEAIHRIIPVLEHRIVSLLPLSHLLEQAVGLLYAVNVGADILYVRSRNPRVIFEAIRDHRTTSMILVPQVLDLFWSSIEREVARSGRAAIFARLRAIARHLPYGARRWLFRRVHREFGGGLQLLVGRTIDVSCSGMAGAWGLSRKHYDASLAAGKPLFEKLDEPGVLYGSTECGFATCTSREDHGLGTVGRSVPPVEVRLADDGEIQVRGPNVFGGYWRDPDATAAAFTADGWYRTGDIGRFDADGRLILMGRSKDIIVLPNGFNVYPEDIENALRVAGVRDSVVLETRPGRIEAVVLAPGSTGIPQGGDIPAHRAAGLGDDAEAVRALIDSSVKRANVTLGQSQRIAGWRLWPDADFPRTHTLKVKRDQVRAWAAVEEQLPVRQGA